jgi:hypothetical protein
MKNSFFSVSFGATTGVFTNSKKQDLYPPFPQGFSPFNSNLITMNHHTLTRPPNSPREISYYTRIIAGLLIIYCGIISGVSAEDWQPEEVRKWVYLDTPSGWSVTSELDESDSPEKAIVTTISNDKKTRIKYILDHNQDEMSTSDIKTYQSQYMSRNGFRICLTKDPVIAITDKGTSYQQTYVRGTGDAAVMGTLIYPGWGQAHYALIMEGQQAVANYYELLPPQIQDHIRPVVTDITASDKPSETDADPDTNER